MFDRLEIEALVLGLAQVRHMGDPALASAAGAVLAKVVATLPDAVQQHILHAVSQVYRPASRYPVTPGMAPDLDAIRRACWREEAVTIGYTSIFRRGTCSRS